MFVKINTNQNPAFGAIPADVGGGTFLWTSGKTWAVLYAEIVAAGGAGIVEVIGDPTSPFTFFEIPPGVYDLTQVSFQGTGVYGGLINIQAGATIDGATSCNLNLSACYITTNAAVCAAGKLLGLRLESSTIMAATDATAFPGVLDASLILLEQQSFLAETAIGTQPLITLASAASLNMICTNVSILGQRAFGPSVGGALVYLQADLGSLTACTGSASYQAPSVLSVPNIAILGDYMAHLSTITPIKTGAYTADYWNTVRVDASGGAFANTLPTAAGKAGQMIYYKSVVNTVNAVTIGTTGGQTVDGAATFPLSGNRPAATFESDGTNWMVM